jgi:hypothetical protein
VNSPSETLYDGDTVANTFVESWSYLHTIVHLHLFGFRRNPKRPRIDVCATFERDPKLWLSSKAEFSGKTGPKYRSRHGVYDVQGSVFVDDVKPANFIKRLPKLPDHRLCVRPLPFPAVIRLQGLDYCPLSIGEAADVDPSLRGKLISFGVESRLDQYGERRFLDNFIGDVSPEFSLEKLKDHMIEGASKIVKSVTQDERKSGVNRIQIADVKALRESIVVTLHLNGVSAHIDAPVEFLQDAVVLSGMVHLGYSTFNTPVTHAE